MFKVCRKIINSGTSVWGFINEEGFAQKVVSVRVSGRMIVAQQFTAGINEREDRSP